MTTTGHFAEDTFTNDSPHGLFKPELYWREHYDWLLGTGFRLRDRYSPEWIPSWKKDPKLDDISTEDSRVATVSVTSLFAAYH